MVRLETLIGAQNMQAFIKSWFLYNSGIEVTGASFKYEVYDFISRNFGISQRNEIIQNLNWDAWTLESAGPPNVLEMTQEKVTFAINLGDDYITLAGASSPDGAAAFKNYPR